MSSATGARNGKDDHIGGGDHAVGVRPRLDAARSGERRDAIRHLNTLGLELSDVRTQGADLEGLLSKEHVQHHNPDHQDGDHRRREEQEARMKGRTRPTARSGARDRRPGRGSRRSGGALRNRNRSRHRRPEAYFRCGNTHAATARRSAARNFALRALGFSWVSSDVGTIGFFVRITRRGSARKARFTRPSSNE